MLNKTHMAAFLEQWMAAWNGHDLDSVLRHMADDVVFEHWNGGVVRGKRQLGRVWQPWFAAHGDFHFEVKGICVDPTEESFSFEWSLEWPSPESKHLGQREVRQGIDVIELRDGKIIRKRSYIKTLLRIDSRSIQMKA